MPKIFSLGSTILWTISVLACYAIDVVSPLPTLAEQPATLAGKIYTNISYQKKDENNQTKHVITNVAIDPNTGEFEDIGPIGHSLRVSPEGKRFLVCQFTQREGLESSSNLHVMDAATQESSVFQENAKQPVWSGDGKQILFNRGKVGEKWSAFVLNLASKELTQLSLPGTDEVDDWSNTGDWLVTVSDRHPPHGSGYQLYVMHPDGSGEQRITEGPGLNCYPRFRPGTNQVLYAFQRRGTQSLRVVDLDGKNMRELLATDDEGRNAPDGACWSPDGKWICVNRFDWGKDANGRLVLRADEDAHHRLEIISADGTPHSVLKLKDIETLTFLGHPDWR